MDSIQSFVITLLSSAGLSAILTGVLVWLTRSWISERLRNSIKHEYDLKLAAANQTLQSQAEAQITELKASIEREAEKVRFATASIGESQRVVIAKRLEAIDTLWAGVLAVRKNVPVVMGFIDILTVDEYVSMGNHPDFKAMVGEISTEKIAEMFEDNVGSRERIRPYVGEYLWAIVSTYQSIILRVCLLIQMGEADPAKLNWHQDHGIRQLINSSLSQNEITAFDSTKIGKVGWLRRNYENKILRAIETILSGRELGEEAMRQAQAMEALVEAQRRQKLLQRQS